MKNLFYSLALAFIYACATTGDHKQLADGFYLVEKPGNDSSKIEKVESDQILIAYDYTFADTLPQLFSKVLVSTNDFVPLELTKIPEVVPQSSLTRKLQISLTEEASDKLRDFSKTYLMKQVAIVLDGKAVTLHKIRAVIEGPDMEITGSSDNACERLAARMAANVKK